MLTNKRLSYLNSNTDRALQPCSSRTGLIYCWKYRANPHCGCTENRSQTNTMLATITVMQLKLLLQETHNTASINVTRVATNKAVY